MIYLSAAGIYFFENPEQPENFSSIFTSLWWAVVTLTTVGYGDIAPQTAFGQAIASFVMILGYAIIAVPTGIVSSELHLSKDKKKTCKRCKETENKLDANYCFRCGESFD